MFILEFIISFSLASLFLNYLKIKAVFVYKKIKYLKNNEFNDILKEWESIRKQLGIKDLNADIYKFYYKHHETIINAKIIKRYNKYFDLDEIPTYVFKYTTFKVKEKIDQGEKTKQKSDNIKSIFNNPKQYYRVLDASEKDDLKTIKKKYRDKMKIYHPDKLSFLSLEEKKKGEEESKKINEAYDYICKIKK